MIDDRDGIRRDVPVSPLHDGVHPLPRAASGLSFRQPDRTQNVSAITRADCIELAVPKFWKDVGLERADPLRGMLFILPTWLEIFFDLSGTTPS